jgi:hypothetical protein
MPVTAMAAARQLSVDRTEQGRDPFRISSNDSATTLPGESSEIPWAASSSKDLGVPSDIHIRQQLETNSWFAATIWHLACCNADE